MKATNDSLILDEKDLCYSITNDERVHIFNKKRGDIVLLRDSLAMYLEKNPKSRKAKGMIRDFDSIIRNLDKNKKIH